MEGDASEEEVEDPEQAQLERRNDEYFKQIIALGQKIMEENEDKPFWSTGIIGSKNSTNQRNGNRGSREDRKYSKE